MNCTSTNGRVNILSPDTSTLFAMQDRIPIDSRDTSFREAMTGNWYNTSLSDAFFSAQNIDFLQGAIKYGVYKRSNSQYVIGHQDPDILKINFNKIGSQGYVAGGPKAWITGANKILNK